MTQIINSLLTRSSQSRAYSPQKITIISNTLTFNLFIFILIISTAIIIYKKKRDWFVQALVSLTLFDLFVFSKGNLISLPFNSYTKQNQAAVWLSQNLENLRFISTNGNLPYTGLGVYWTHLRAREPFSPNQLTSEELHNFTRFTKELEFLPENQGMRFRLQDVSGYSATVLTNYSKFWEEKPTSPNAIKINSLLDEKLNLLGVKYIITGYPNDYIQNLETEKYKLVTQLGEQKIYENTQAWPRAFLLNQENKTAAKIISYKPTEVIIQTQSEKESFLVLTDNNYPGWKSFIDKQEVPINSFMGAFRSIIVPAGTHKVEFIFKSSSFKLGVIISLISTAFLITNFIWQKKAK